MDHYSLLQDTQPKFSFPTIKAFGFLFVAGIVVVFIILFQTMSPSDAPETTITIPEGYSIIQTGETLEENNVIRSASLFSGMARVFGGSVLAGSYEFSGKEGLFDVLNRVSKGDYGDVYIWVTLPEGSTLQQMSEIIDDTELHNFDHEEFLAMTEDQQGYLFPDTYRFLPDADAQDVITKLSDTFDKRIAEIQDLIDESDRELEEIVIMASIIEKEASNDFKQKQMVSGILWKRIAIDMLLQVDAPFLYYLGKGSAELRLSDLRADHPYNTYVNKGLTPGPIGNPGLDSLRASADPVESSYLFYLHDLDGGIHYAETNNGHVRNKNKYLR